jgi:hypothetical protein
MLSSFPATDLYHNMCKSYSSFVLVQLWGALTVVIILFVQLFAREYPHKKTALWWGQCTVVYSRNPLPLNQKTFVFVPKPSSIADTFSPCVLFGAKFTAEFFAVSNDCVRSFHFMLTPVARNPYHPAYFPVHKFVQPRNIIHQTKFTKKLNSSAENNCT